VATGNMKATRNRKQECLTTELNMTFELWIIASIKWRENSRFFLLCLSNRMFLSKLWRSLDSIVGLPGRNKRIP